MRVTNNRPLLNWATSANGCQREEEKVAVREPRRMTASLERRSSNWPLTLGLGKAGPKTDILALDLDLADWLDGSAILDGSMDQWQTSTICLPFSPPRHWDPLPLPFF